MATEVHHVRPLEDYPGLALDLDNLESLCRRCHERTKRRKTKPHPKVRIIKA